MRSDGEWTAIYNRWLAELARSGPQPAQGGLRQETVSDASVSGCERASA